ncbi:MAG: Spy/CpxP family protein refolding chaperone [Rhizomicrobium sp.]|jgi:hypothetical protein
MGIRKFAIALATLGLISFSPALAQDTTDGTNTNPHHRNMPTKEQMAAWHTQRCGDHYAHAAGRLAFIEAKLNITEAQRPLFDHWRDAVLQNVQSRKSECLAHQFTPGEQHSILERTAMMQKRLESRLAALQSEQPALAALYQSLAPDQKSQFDQPRHGFGRGHGGPMHHHQEANG